MNIASLARLRARHWTQFDWQTASHLFRAHAVSRNRHAMDIIHCGRRPFPSQGLLTPHVHHRHFCGLCLRVSLAGSVAARFSGIYMEMKTVPAMESVPEGTLSLRAFPDQAESVAPPSQALPRGFWHLPVGAASRFSFR